MKKLLALLLLLPSLVMAQTHTAGMLDLSQVWTATNTFNFLSSQAGYITIATATLTSNSVNAFDLTTSSGIFVPNTAGVYAGFFSGNGAALTNVAAASANTIPASGVQAGTFNAGVIEPTGNIDLSTVTAALALKVAKAGDTMTGTLNMTNVPIVLTGPNGYVTSASSVNASSFFGSGINITGTYLQNGNVGTTLSCTPSQSVVNTIVSGGLITGGICGASGGTGTAIGWNLDDFTSAANGVTQNFTFSATVANSSGVFIVRDGLTLRPNADYVFTPPTSLHMNVAPSNTTTSFFATYTVNLASGPLAAVLNSTQTFSASNTFTQLIKLTSGAAAGLVLTSGADGTATWQPDVDAGNISGSGTNGNLTRFTGTSSVGNASMTDDGTTATATFLKVTTGAVQGYVAIAGDSTGKIEWAQPGSIDPPGLWTCTIRTGLASSATANNTVSSSVSCVGTEKLISGGCSIGGSTQGTFLTVVGTPSGTQTWTCYAQAPGAGATTTPSANCCQ